LIRLSDQLVDKKSRKNWILDDWTEQQMRRKVSFDLRRVEN